jgi:iron complex transport system ATP-binding protein
MKTGKRFSTTRVFQVENLSAGYDTTEVLHDVSFIIQEGEFLGISGPNGAGKSTLLRVLAGLIEPKSGTVRLYDRFLGSYTRREIAQIATVIFQDFSSPYDFAVFDIVAMGRNPFVSRWKPLSAHDRAIIQSVMETTEITDLHNRSFQQLSGGEKQRTIIAKSLAQEPSVLMLDEPSTHLDLHHQVNVFNILRRLNREKNVTVICITHDLTLASQYVSRFILLSNGRLLAEGSPRDVVRKNMIEHLYHTPVSVGMMAETNSPYVFPIGIYL